MDQIARWLQSVSGHFARPLSGAACGIAAALTVGLLAAASVPAIQAYQRDDKGNTRAVSEIITQTWQPGDTFLITPAYDGFVYKYYIEAVYRRSDIASRLFVADWQAILTLKDQGGSVFLITPYALTHQEDEQLRSLGYLPQYHSYAQSRYAKTLWLLKK